MLLSELTIGQSVLCHISTSTNGTKIQPIKGTPISKALSCMKTEISILSDRPIYFLIFSCMGNLHILHRLIHVPYSFGVLSSIINHFVVNILV